MQARATGASKAAIENALSHVACGQLSRDSPRAAPSESCSAFAARARPETQEHTRSNDSVDSRASRNPVQQRVSALLRAPRMLAKAAASTMAVVIPVARAKVASNAQPHRMAERARLATATVTRV
jgi:hypothetical protein